MIKLCPLVVKGIINGPFACLVLQQYNESSVIIWQHFKITRRRRRKRSVRKVFTAEGHMRETEGKRMRRAI